MNKQVLIGLILLSSVLRMNAQIYTPSGSVQGSSGNNNVGIGTTTPVSKLTIGNSDDIQTTTGIGLGSDHNSIELVHSDYGTGYGSKIYGKDLGGGATAFTVAVRGNSTTWLNSLTIRADDANGGRNGNVGIGTTDPQSKFATFQYAGSPTFTGTVNLASAIGGQFGHGSYNGIDFFNTTAGGTIPLARIAMKTIDGLGSFLSFGTTNYWGSGITNEAMTINPSGNVGIGTTNPKANLDVGGYNAGGALRAVLARQGEGDANNDSGTSLSVRAWATQTNQYNGKMFSLENSFYGLLNSSIEFYRGGNTTGGFIAFTTDNGTEKMRILANGNVGIGYTSGSEITNNKLAVNGSGYFNENIMVGGAVARGFEREIGIKGGDSHAALGLSITNQQTDLIISQASSLRIYDRTGNRNLLDFNTAGIVTFPTLASASTALVTASTTGQLGIVPATDFAPVSHNHFLGNLDAETGRNSHSTGIYSFNRYSGTLGNDTPASYYSVIAWGNGSGGSAELASSWFNGGNDLYYRSLRDYQEDWFSWKKIWHSGNFNPSDYAKRTSLTNGYIPYHISDAIGLGNTDFFYNGTNYGLGYSTGAEITNNKLAVNGSGYFAGDLKNYSGFANLSGFKASGADTNPFIRLYRPSGGSPTTHIWQAWVDYDSFKIGHVLKDRDTESIADFSTRMLISSEQAGSRMIAFGGTLVSGYNGWNGSGVFGEDGEDKVMIGHLTSQTNGAVIGGHNSDLSAWAPLNISGSELKFNIEETNHMKLTSSGLTVSNLSGTGTRLVGATADGTLSAQANGTGYLFNDGSGNMSYSNPEVTSLMSTGASANKVATANGSNGMQFQSLKTINGASLLGSTDITTGNVTKVGTPAQYQLGVWTGDGTINGVTSFTFGDIFSKG